MLLYDDKTVQGAQAKPASLVELNVSQMPAQPGLPSFMVTMPGSIGNLPVMYHRDINGEKVPYYKTSDGFLVCEFPDETEECRIPIRADRPLILVAAKLKYDYHQSGSHASDDYWNLHQGFTVLTMFVLSESDGLLEHLASISVIPRDEIKASGLRMPEESELISGLMRRNIPETIERIRLLNFGGKKLDDIDGELEILRKPSQYYFVEKREVTIIPAGRPQSE